MRKKKGWEICFCRKTVALVIAFGMTVGSAGTPVFAQEYIPDEKQETVSEQMEEERLKEPKSAEKESSISGNDTEEQKEECAEEPVVPCKGTDEKESGTSNAGETSGCVEETEDVHYEMDEGESKDGEGQTVSENAIEEEESENRAENEEVAEIIDVVVPAAYTLALNPYCLPVRMGENEITTAQVIAGTYGIVNKSSNDQIVTVSLMVEDNNGGEIIFVDSADEAENAGEGVYALYLSAVPANEEEVLIGGKPVREDVSREDLQCVEMTGAADRAVTLHGGTNQIAFQLSGAVYARESNLDTKVTEVSGDVDEKTGNKDIPDGENDVSKENAEVVLMELAPDGAGITAYTFSGVLNPNASWEELAGGIKLSVAYTYQRAEGSEEVIEGTGAMICAE